MEPDQLLKLAPLLTQEMLHKVLEHDRWKTEATFAHEIKLEELRLYSKRSGGGGKPSTDGENCSSAEDKKFNEITSYGVCNDKHLGLLSKTKIWEGANDRSAKLFERWHAHLQENNVIPLKDLREGRVKTLLLAFLWASGCGHRAAKWPEASDIYLLETLRKDLRDRFSKFSKHSITAAYESLKVFWKEINDYEQASFNSSLIAEVLDEAYQYVSQKAQEESKVDIKNSPLFTEFQVAFPHVPLDMLEKYYVKNRYNFIPAGIGALRKNFTTTPPPELEQKFAIDEWPKKWHTYLPSYEPLWQKQLTSIFHQAKQEQEKWKEE